MKPDLIALSGAHRRAPVDPPARGIDWLNLATWILAPIVCWAIVLRLVVLVVDVLSSRVH